MAVSRSAPGSVVVPVIVMVSLISAAVPPASSAASVVVTALMPVSIPSPSCSSSAATSLLGTCSVLVAQVPLCPPDEVFWSIAVEVAAYDPQSELTAPVVVAPEAEPRGSVCPEDNPPLLLLDQFVAMLLGSGVDGLTVGHGPMSILARLCHVWDLVGSLVPAPRSVIPGMLWWGWGCVLPRVFFNGAKALSRGMWSLRLDIRFGNSQLGFRIWSRLFYWGLWHWLRSLFGRLESCLTISKPLLDP